MDSLSLEQQEKLRQNGFNDGKIRAYAKSKGLEVQKKSFGQKLKSFGEGVIQSEKNFGESIAGAALTDNFGGRVLRTGSDITGVLTGQGRAGTKAFRAQQGAKESRDQLLTQQQDILNRIKGARSRGEDTSNLMRALQFNKQAIESAPTDFDLNSMLNKTGKQIAGEALGVGVDILSAGTFGKAATAGATTVKQGIKQGIKQGAKSGLLEGAAGGFARGLQDDESIRDAASRGVREGFVGAAAGGVLGGVVGGVSGGLKGRALHKQEARALLGNGELPDVADSPLIKRATKEGIQEKTAKFVRDADLEDKKLFREQFKIAQRAAKTTDVTQRPSDVAGRSVMNRAKFIRNSRAKVGQQLSDAVNTLPDEIIDYTEQTNTFLSRLNDAQVTTKIDDSGKFALDFSNSRFKNNLTVKNKLNETVDFLNVRPDGTVKLKPRDTVTIRQAIFDDLNLAKKGSADLPDSATALLEQLRDDLDEPLKLASPQYAELSQKYARASSALRDFRTLVGKDFDELSGQAERRVGEKIRKILGNNSGVTLDYLENIDDVALDLGGSFKETVTSQASFAQVAEDLFGLSGQNTLESSVARGTGNQLAEGAADVGRGNVFGPLERFFKKSADPAKQQEIISQMIGLNDDGLTNSVLKRIQESLPFKGFDTSVIINDSKQLQGRVDDIALKLREIGLETPFRRQAQRRGLKTLNDLINLAEELIAN